MDKEKTLEEIGLKPAEAKVYLALLKLRETTIGSIIKETGLYKNDIYSSLDKLIKLGLASYFVKNRAKHFRASSPTKLKEILKEKEKKIDEIMPELESMKRIKKEEIKTEIFEGYNGLKTVLKEQLNIVKKDDIIYVINLSVTLPLQKYSLLWNQKEIERQKKGAKTKVLTQKRFKKDIKKEYKKYKLREDRFLDLEIPSTLTIFKDYVEIIVFKENKEPTIFLIKDKDLADSYHQYFNILWKQAKS